jgi:hypothetical protein
LQPTDLYYFNEYFRGRPLPAEWTPPPYKTRGISYKIKDFISWMLSAPVVSEKARDALLPVVDGFAEFRPIGVFRRKLYFVMNVYFLADCLDLESSEILYTPDERQKILDIEIFRFRKEAIPDAPIFMEANHPGDIFVKAPVIDCIREHGLTGAALLDPSVSAFDIIMGHDYVDALVGYNMGNPNQKDTPDLKTVR